MSLSERVYRRLLGLYPDAFRAEYGEPMARLFADQRRDALRDGRGGLAWLWLRTLADLLVTAAREHLERHNTMRRVILIAAPLLVGLAIGWIDVHNDEVWAALLLLLSTTFLFGFIEPRTAWRSGLLIGVGIPLVHLVVLPLNIIRPCPPDAVCGPPDLLSMLKLLLVLLPALIGAYCGVAARALSSVERGDVIWWVGSALIGLVVGLLSLRTRPVGNVILVVGLLGLMGGFTRPSGVWRWALPLALIPALILGAPEFLGNPGMVLLKVLINAVAPAFVGVYAGFGLRWLLDKYLPPKTPEPQPSAG